MTDTPSLSELVAVLKNARNALNEAEAILGSEYGDHYGVLAQQMARFDIDLTNLLSRLSGNGGGAAPTALEGKDK